MATYHPTRKSIDRRVWVRDMPTKYELDWDGLGLVKPTIAGDGHVIRCKYRCMVPLSPHRLPSADCCTIVAVPFYAAQQLHHLRRVPRQLRGATKPMVVTTSKIGEPVGILTTISMLYMMLYKLSL